MRIQNINSTNFNGIQINAKENKHVKYLYNKVSDVIKEERVGTVFGTDFITTSEKPSVLEKLKELGVKFFQTK